LIVVVIVVVVFCVRHQRQSRRRKSLMMVFSRSDSTNPVLEMQTIETQSVTVSSLSVACSGLVIEYWSSGRILDS